MDKELDVLFVFDGQVPEHKKDTHLARRKTFPTLNNMADKLLRTNDYDNHKKAWCIKIKLMETRNLSETLINFLEEKNLICIRAEYEADTLIAKKNFELNNCLIITEDTDFVAYGCNFCLFNFDGAGGFLFDRSKLNWPDLALFQSFCVLCGCDYFTQKKVGIKTARKICASKSSLDDFFKDKKEDWTKFIKALKIFVNP